MSVGFKQEKGIYKPFGKWPSDFVGQTVDPATDPYNFYTGVMGELRALSPEDFACRPIMFWGPENRWHHLYTEGRPCCVFHPGEVSCVKHNGWSNYYRQVFDETGVTALTGREYICKTRQDQKQNHVFYSYDAAVVSQAPA
jgi:hypothetical protein